MSAYYPTAYPDYSLSPSANQSGYPTIIDSADYVNPQILSPHIPVTFTLSDLYCQQTTLLDPYQFTGAFSHSSGSDYTESPPNTGYLATDHLLQRQPQSASRHIWGVRPDPDPTLFISDTDPIPSIRKKASLPPSLLAAKPFVATPSSPGAQAPLRGNGDVELHSARLFTSSLGVHRQDDGYGSSSSTTTPSSTPSPTSATFPSSSSQAGVKSEASSDSGYRSSPSESKQTDFRRRRADRRRSKLLEIAAILPFRATDPDEMSSHDKRRCYVGTLEEYVIWLEKEMKFFGGNPTVMKKVVKHKGMTCRSLRTMLAHFQEEAHKLHEQVQTQEREALELQALLDEEDGASLETSNTVSCTPISSPFTTAPIQSQLHPRPQLSASQLEGYEY